MKALTRVAATAGFAILVGGASLTPQLATSEDTALAATPSAPHAPRAAAVTTGDDRDADDPNDAFTDLYGNEVSDAIATYTFDQSGSLYELHSPQTELPRLGIPKS